MSNGVNECDNDDDVDSNTFQETNQLPLSELSKKFAYLSTPVDSLTYKMNHNKRGKCLIFNHQKFDARTKLGERKGSDVDAHALNKCFQKFDFDTKIINDPSFEDIKVYLKEVSQEDHSDCDCILISVLTHGDQEVLWARDEKYYIDTIFSYFTGDKCPTLVGKPKIFIIQACRGGHYDSGVTLHTQIDETDGSEHFRIPTQADFLIVYSTPPGYFSFRNPTTGSYFVQALVAVLNQYAVLFNVDFMTLLTIVNKNVAYKFESNVPDNIKVHKKKQIPCITSMLTRLVFLAPKLRETVI